jgi:hypothetical protein
MASGLVQQRTMNKILSCVPVFLILLCSCATQPSNKIIVQPNVVYLKPNRWVISFSPGMPNYPFPGGEGCWYFDFPSSDGVHYIMVPYTASKPHKTLTITFKVTALTGNPRFISVETGCNEAADFRPILERQGDMLSASQEFYRWWSSDKVKLVADGRIHTLSVPLTPDRWGSVFGKNGTQAPTEFATSLQNLMGVGITFGGGCFAGHGVYVTGGKARFTLLNYQIQ